jgi:hypothetical protein
MKKEHPIIMLPSEKPSQIWKWRLGLALMSSSRRPQKGAEGAPQHLYTLSDEEVKVGEYCIYGSKLILWCEADENGWNKDVPRPKKIIATTDVELYVTIGEHYNSYNKELPQIPQHIIEAYVKKPFDKVMVEYEEIIINRSRFELPNIFETRPKLNPDGTLAVSLVEEKVYSREEVVNLVRKLKGQLIWDIDKWIKENL